MVLCPIHSVLLGFESACRWQLLTDCPALYRSSLRVHIIFLTTKNNKHTKILLERHKYRFFLGYSFPPHLRPNKTGSGLQLQNFFRLDVFSSLRVEF